MKEHMLQEEVGGQGGVFGCANWIGQSFKGAVDTPTGDVLAVEPCIGPA